MDPSVYICHIGVFTHKGIDLCIHSNWILLPAPLVKPDSLVEDDVVLLTQQYEAR